MKTLAIVGLLLCACTAAGDSGPGGAGGKADELSPDQIPMLAEAYALRLDGLFRRCMMDFRDRDDDGDTEECHPDTKFGEPKTDEVTVFGLWAAQQDGAEVHGPLKICRAKSMVDGATLSISDKTMRSLPALEYGGRLLSVTNAAWFVSDRAAVVIGAKLDDPFEDDLPTDPDDPRVFDVDNDGEPGISLSVESGSVYMAMLVTFQTEGPVADDGSSAGAADLNVQQEVYGDSIPFFNARASAQRSKETSKALDSEHTFELAPMVVGADCDDVVERFDSKD
jgi:hypothetical protein